MPRVIWKGSISFGLVNVPVALYSAERSEELKFVLLDKRDMSEVGYRRVNKRTGKEVPWEEVVRGYEYEEGQYVLLTDEDFRQANVKATQTVEIVDFVPRGEISDIYYEKPYYLEPIMRGEKGYALLRETLRRTERVGIAKVVLHTRQHLAALEPQANALVLNLLRFAHDLRDLDEIKTPPKNIEDLNISPKEIEMAERLVEGMAEAWNPGKYHDDYRDDVLAMIQKKIASGKTTVVEEVATEEAPRSAEIIDLMTLLKRSVEQTQNKRQRSGSSKSVEKSKKNTRKRA